MTEREALKLALEALEEAWYHVGTFQPTEKAIDLYDEARAAIKEALAQQDVRDEIDRGAKTLRETYLAQPEQEPVAWRHDMGEENGGWEYFEEASCPDCQPLYTTPPQRTWVELTDEEIDPDAEKSDNYAAFHGGVRFAQAKLKEKNGA